MQAAHSAHTAHTRDMLQKQQALISGNTFNTATLKSAATAARQHMHTRRASRVVHGLVLLLLPLLLPPLLLFLLLLVALLGRRLAAELVDAALGEPRRVLEIQEGGVSVSMPRGQRRGRQRAGGCLPPRWRSRAESASTVPGRARCPRPRWCGRAQCRRRRPCGRSDGRSQTPRSCTTQTRGT